ncbi:MAG TPA: hypothetical protein VIH42_02280 [Thermoguttaceae bacterium]
MDNGIVGHCVADRAQVVRQQPPQPGETAAEAGLLLGQHQIHGRTVEEAVLKISARQIAAKSDLKELQNPVQQPTELAHNHSRSESDIPIFPRNARECESVKVFQWAIRGSNL